MGTIPPWWEGMIRRAVARSYGRLKWTEEDYFRVPQTLLEEKGEANSVVELSDEELIMPPWPTDTHQRVLGTLYATMRTFVLEGDLGIIRFAPLPVHLWPGKIRMPDIMFLAREHAGRVDEVMWGVPDLVVEVVGLGTEETDHEIKPLEYAHAGIPECWIVDPDTQSISVLVLKPREAGTYRAYTPLGEFVSGQTAHSRLLQGFQIAVDDVFAE